MLDGTVITANQNKNIRQECNEGLAQERAKNVLLHKKRKMSLSKLSHQNGVNEKTGLMAVRLAELCSRNVKETDTENMWQSQRRTACACCRDSRVVDLSAASTDAFAMFLSSCLKPMQR